MNNELIIEKFEKQDKSSKNSGLISQIVSITSDSIFYFAIFMAAFFVIKSIFPVFEANSIFNLTINEVTVSLIGFANVFFFKVYKNLLTPKSA